MRCPIVLRAGAILLVAISFAACSADGSAPATPAPTATRPAPRLRVVTSIAPLSDIVKNVGGDRIDVTTLVPDGGDARTFRPAADAAATVSAADLIILNGAQLEPTIGQLVEQASVTAPAQRLAEQAFAGADAQSGIITTSSGKPNPFLWMDPNIVIRYAQLVDGWLGAAAPADKTYFDDNLAAYRTRLTNLDQAIRAAAETVPASQRTLLTFYDSWDYWGRAYSWSVIPAFRPANLAAPTDLEVTALVDQIIKEEVPAIFGPQIPGPPIPFEISHQAGAAFFDGLRDQQLPGVEGTPEHTYAGMIVRDVQIIVTALGGSTAALDGFPLGDTYAPG